MLLRHLDIPNEIYYKMVEYVGTDDTKEIYEFILDVLISYIDIHTELENDLAEAKKGSDE
tara:strand:- start:170 stop:349 length:180 start_codon:yes stop_codon:yes gene_type:complete